MVTIGHEPVHRYGFHPPGDVGGVEVTTWSALSTRTTVELRRPHRTDFHQLLLVDKGTTTHRVDFVDHPCRPGTLLWVRPGQVQQFGANRRLGARLVLFVAEFPAPAPPLSALIDDPLAPTRWPLDRAQRQAVGTTLDALDAASKDQTTPTGIEIARHLLTVLLLQLAARQPARRDDHTSVYTRLHAELERSYARTRRVEDYAARLGYTPRTLTRACLATVGRTAKQVIDERVILEAKRRLAHTDTAVETIARQLGFTEPTNFGKFFTRRAGLSPGAFRTTTHTSR